MPDASLDLMADSGPGTILHARTNVQNGVWVFFFANPLLIKVTLP